MLNKKIAYIVMSFILGALIYTSCTKVQRDNEFDPSAINYRGPQTNKIILLTENFDNYTANLMLLPPSPWNSFMNGAINISLQLEGVNNSIGLRFQGTPNIGNSASCGINVNLSGHFFIEYDMQYKNGTDIWDMSLKFPGGAAPYFQYGWNGLTINVPKFFYSANLMTFPTELGANNPMQNIWYRLKMEIDTSTKQIKMWFKKHGDANYYVFSSVLVNNLPSSIVNLEFYADSGPYAHPWQTHIIDNLEIYKLEVVP